MARKATTAKSSSAKRPGFKGKMRTGTGSPTGTRKATRRFRKATARRSY